MRGVHVAITDEELESALLRLSAGDNMTSVTAELGVCRSALQWKAHSDPDFRDRLRLALEMGAYAAAENTFSIARGEPGFSTGSIERDKLLVDVSWRWAKTVGNRIFGDKLAVDHRQIVMKFTSDDEGMI